MYDTVLSYLISLGIVGVGLAWIVTGRDSATSAIWIAIGVLTVAVGLWSLVTLLRKRTE
jgi:phosphate starvation-inducible membrane PsiE